MGFEFQSQTFDKWAQIQIVVELERGRTIFNVLKTSPNNLTSIFERSYITTTDMIYSIFLLAFEMLEWYV